MIIAGYFEDDASDELTKDPVFKAVRGKWHKLRDPADGKLHQRKQIWF